MTTPRAASAEGHRTIDGGGQSWVVSEAPWTDAHGRSCTCLIFENAAVIRRVRDFPLDWRTYAEEALYELSLVF